MKKPTLKPSTHPRYAYEVTAPTALTGKRIRKYFKSKATAAAFHRDLTARANRHGELAMTKEEHLLLARYRPHLTLPEMEEAFRLAIAAKDDSTETFAGLCDAFQQHKDEAHRHGVIQELHLRDIDARVPKMAAAFGEVRLRDLSKEHIQDWLDSLPLAPRSKTNYLRMLRQVINFGVSHDYLTKDPSSGVLCPPNKPTVHILTPGDYQQLVQGAVDMADHLTYWWLVFGGMAGLRTSEIERLDWSDIRPDENQLYVRPGKTHNAERWIPFTPPLTLLDWSQKPDHGLVLGGTHDRTRQTRRQRVYARTRLSVPNNALRHSYASHHLVANNQPFNTAANMGHATPKQTFSAYRRAVTPAQAQAWMSIGLAGPLWPELT